jgi:hypothetical protein
MVFARGADTIRQACIGAYRLRASLCCADDAESRRMLLSDLVCTHRALPVLNAVGAACRLGAREALQTGCRRSPHTCWQVLMQQMRWDSQRRRCRHRIHAGRVSLAVSKCIAHTNRYRASAEFRWRMRRVSSSRPHCGTRWTRALPRRRRWRCAATSFGRSLRHSIRLRRWRASSVH